MPGSKPSEAPEEQDRLPAIFMAATERLAAKRPWLEEIYRHIAGRSLRFLDQGRLGRRIERLMKNPLIEKILEDRGVADELRRGGAVEDLSAEAQGELERVLDGADFMPVWFLTRGAELRRTIGRVRARTAGGREAAGTGFLIGPRLLLTNYHVLDWTDVGQQPLAELAQHSLVEFDYEEQLDGQLQPIATFALDPATLLLASPWHQLDYVLVALQPRSGNGMAIESFGYNRLAGDLGKISMGEAVFIIQHAQGRPKQVVVQNNRLIHIEDGGPPFLTYEADTDRGSSGAPVFNRQWEVVALHHSTEIARDGEGRVLAKNGRPWQPGMGSAEIRYLSLNEGIRISRILADLAAKLGGQESLETPEALSTPGRGLLQEALLTHLGVAPMDLIAPIPVESDGADAGRAASSVAGAAGAAPAARDFSPARLGGDGFLVRAAGPMLKRPYASAAQQGTRRRGRLGGGGPVRPAPGRAGAAGRRRFGGVLADRLRPGDGGRPAFLPLRRPARTDLPRAGGALQISLLRLGDGGLAGRDACRGLAGAGGGAGGGRRLRLPPGVGHSLFGAGLPLPAGGDRLQQPQLPFSAFSRSSAFSCPSIKPPPSTPAAPGAMAACRPG